MNKQPCGFLSSVFPGPVLLSPQLLHTGKLQSGDLLVRSGRSRLCEQVWLDGDLFDQSANDALYATAEEDWRLLTASVESGMPHLRTATVPGPGALGEQLLLRNLNCPALSAGLQFTMADARLRLLRVLPLQLPSGKNFCIYEFQLLDPGLVEPGAALLSLS